MAIPGPYSQIFEVCGSPESLPGHSLEDILTQVPGEQTEREKLPVREAMVRSEASGLLVTTFQLLDGLLWLCKL